MRFTTYALCTLVTLPAVAHAQMAPPPPVQTVAPAASSTEHQATAETKKDSGRNFEILWARGEYGYAKIGLAAFSANQTGLGVRQDTASGQSFGVSAGIRFVALTLGAEAKRFVFSDYGLWNVGPVVGLNIPIGRFDPSITLRGGYMFSGKIDNGSYFQGAVNGAPPPTSDLTGFAGGLGLALDYYVINELSIGVGADARAVFLTRAAVPQPEGFSSLPTPVQEEILASPLYQAQKSTAGIVGSLGVRLGVHFGL